MNIDSEEFFGEVFSNALFKQLNLTEQAMILHLHYSAIQYDNQLTDDDNYLIVYSGIGNRRPLKKLRAIMLHFFEKKKGENYFFCPLLDKIIRHNLIVSERRKENINKRWAKPKPEDKQTKENDDKPRKIVNNNTFNRLLNKINDNDSN